METKKNKCVPLHDFWLFCLITYLLVGWFCFFHLFYSFINSFIYLFIYLSAYLLIYFCVYLFILDKPKRVQQRTQEDRKRKQDQLLWPDFPSAGIM